jgi:hypothetical protein
VSAHLLSKAALHLRLRSLAPVPPVVDEADAASAVEGDEPAGTPGSGGSSIRGRDQSFDRGSTP